MLTLDILNEILSRVVTPCGEYRAGDDGGALWLQITLATDDSTGESDCREWRGRKWRVSRHSTEREVVGTAFAALLMALEHEARESFRYRGAVVFGPHIPLAALQGASLAEPDSR